MQALPQTILEKLLTIRNTQKERLSDQEAQLAAKIRHCILCGHFWVQRKETLPDRCPACHKHGWDRPLLQAMIDSEANKRTLQLPPADVKKEE